MKNKQVQGLRGLSILLIMTFHFFVRYVQLFHNEINYNKIVFEFSHIGIIIFFLISGYYLSDCEGGFNLFKKRVCKMWPMYFFSITFVFLITS